ncbi:MAG TPA: hypothetical protein VJS42_04550 [Steroidobacteraceae bacterium]|nr:hypothetical protein [Steroidobacteraceae bacterium]
MKESVTDLLRATADVLAQDVLPHLGSRSWEASRIRSLLMLLQYCDDRVLHESAVLSKSNQLIREFLARASSHPISSQLGPRARAVLTEVTTAPKDGGHQHEDDLEKSSEILRSVLSRVIRAAGTDRLNGSASDGEFRALLHALLKQLHDTERVLFDRACLLLPM